MFGWFIGVMPILVLWFLTLHNCGLSDTRAGEHIFMDVIIYLDSSASTTARGSKTKPSKITHSTTANYKLLQVMKESSMDAGGKLESSQRSLSAITKYRPARDLQSSLSRALQQTGRTWWDSESDKILSSTYNTTLIRTADTARGSSNSSDCREDSGKGSGCNIRMSIQAYCDGDRKNCQLDHTAGVCSRPDVKISDGIGYLSHPLDCDYYIQCYPDLGGRVTAVTRYCGPGLFWNQEETRCDKASNVSCQKEKCKNPHLSHYNMAGNCRVYWICQNGRSFPACCDKGHAYFWGQGCKPSTQCQESCPIQRKLTRDCNLRPDPAFPSRYDVMLDSLGWQARSCSPGVFDVARCSCSADHVLFSECSLQFPMTIGKQMHGNEESEVLDLLHSEDHGRLLGNSSITVPMSLMDITTRKAERPLKIKLRYKESSPLKEPQVLVQSSPCNYGGLLVLYLDEMALHARLFIRQGQLVSTILLTEGFSATRWKDLDIDYSSSGLRVAVSSGALFYLSFVKVPPGLSVSECGWVFGYPEGLDHLKPFTGYLDEIQVAYC